MNQILYEIRCKLEEISITKNENQLIEVKDHFHPNLNEITSISNKI
jgi:hypothetical protein